MEEQRTFSGAIARLFGLLLAIILFVLAIWFVIRLVNETTNNDADTSVGVVAVEDDSTDSVIDTRIGNAEIVVGENDGELAAATEDEIIIAAESSSSTSAASDSSAETGTVLAASDALPNTGPGEYILGLFSAIFALQMYKAARKSRARLNTV